MLPDESEKQSFHSSVQFNTDNYKKTEIRQLPADINELVSDSNLILPANLNLNRPHQQAEESRSASPPDTKVVNPLEDEDI